MKTSTTSLILRGLLWLAALALVGGCNNVPTPRSYDLRIELDPAPATPQPPTPLAISLPNEVLLDDFERPVAALTAVAAGRLRRRTPLVVRAAPTVAAANPPAVPAAVGVAITAS